MYSRFKRRGFLRKSIASLHLGTNLFNKKKNHYEVLEVSPKATKSQIKKSYYKLSLMYHPDKSKEDEETSAKFRDITEAYEILGDSTKRRMYDRGLFGSRGPSLSAAEAEMHSKVQKPSKSKVPSTGRTAIYNFDEWSRFHYQENFQRKQREKKAFEEYVSGNRVEAKRTNAVIYAILVLSLTSAYISFIAEKDRYDKPR